MKVAASVVASRRHRLEETIATEGFAPLAVLSRRLGVSVATARRDLAHLHEKGCISRVHGGAVPLRRGGEAESHSRAASKAHAQDGSVRALFDSRDAFELKAALCEAGRRCWRRNLVDGASGHFSARLGEYVLCTPAGVGRGAMRPEMICLVDFAGRQVASHGNWKRSPEVLADLAIYRAAPIAAAVAHAHPPYATAYAACEVGPPPGILAEFEVLAGPLARVDYRMPGSPELASLVGEAAANHSSILLRNHGAICWGTSVDDACLKLETTEAYCQTAAIAAHLPGKLSPIPPAELAALLEAKRRLGIPDPRLTV